MSSRDPVCVFCASSPGNKAIYEQAATSVGQALAANGNQCVYGGGVRGLMGTVSASCLEAGGKAHGIIPSALTGRAAEKAVREARSGSQTPASEDGRSKEGTGATVLKGGEEDYDGRYTNEVVKTMHERKLRMAQLSTGGFIVLPGGFGTFEEVMEMVTWNQLRIHRRPVVVLNVNGFYSPLRQQIELAVAEGFITPANISLIKFVDLQDGDDEARDWGRRAVEALQSWVWDESAGYNLQWKEEGK
ncbi:hypothetical protein NliqN6_0476 [Naganishia liquefaciens]|uniref:TIGR00730 family Rossman fold protein n=1 Tax=Naganishia liquefaciens TaxID=104408 RepID=A0A8H3TNF7_9TREE|nr:hypothetical protein NliqN6_0476 [Naganishia liquefaciens]